MPLPDLMRRGYQPLKEVLEAELPRTMKLLDINLNTTQMSHVVNSFSELELQPDALEAFQILIKAGWQLIALTNGRGKGSEAATKCHETARS
jgi:2-haloacid dehalogenase